MFEPEVFQKQMYCIEESRLLVKLLGLWRPHSDSAPGEMCPPCSPSFCPCCLSRYEMTTRYARNCGGHGPIGPPGFAYGVRCMNVFFKNFYVLSNTKITAPGRFFWSSVTSLKINWDYLLRLKKLKRASRCVWLTSSSCDKNKKCRKLWLCFRKYQ